MQMVFPLTTFFAVKTVACNGQQLPTYACWVGWNLYVKLAVRVGFEPTIELPLFILSRDAP